jgi:hypothetical protein
VHASGVDGAHGVFGIGEAGQDNSSHGRIVVCKQLHEFDTVHTRHLDVTDDNIEAAVQAGVDSIAT